MKSRTKTSKRVVEIEQPTPVRLRDRIVELRRIRASELVDNSKNWRRHPDEQVGAMNSILEKIGFTGALIGRDTPDGVQLIDGHLRKSIAGDEKVPVLIVDLTEKEVDLMLATYDPLSDLAIMDAEALRVLLEAADDSDDAFMRKLMTDVSDDIAHEMQSSKEKPSEVDGMALQPHEHYDFLVVACQTSHEWNVLCERLGLKPEARRARMGTSRAIRATRLLEKLHGNA